jgi:hypothetical protein
MKKSEDLATKVKMSCSKIIEEKVCVCVRLYIYACEGSQNSHPQNSRETTTEPQSSAIM